MVYCTFSFWSCGFFCIFNSINREYFFSIDKDLWHTCRNFIVNMNFILFIISPFLTFIATSLRCLQCYIFSCSPLHIRHKFDLIITFTQITLSFGSNFVTHFFSNSFTNQLKTRDNLFWLKRFLLSSCPFMSSSSFFKETLVLFLIMYISSNHSR